MNYDKILRHAVSKKWHTPELKEWWWTKFSAARRLRTIRLSEAQNHRCAFCSELTYLREEERGKMSAARLATLEHLQPQSQGGTDHLSNCVMSCQSCNNMRGTMDAMTFYKLRQNRVAWLALLEKQARERQAHREESNKEKSEVKSQKRATHAYNLAVACLVDPDFQARFSKFLEASQVAMDNYQELTDRHNLRERRQEVRLRTAIKEARCHLKNTGGVRQENSLDR